MAATKGRGSVPGSEKKPLRGAKIVGKPDAAQRIEITVLVRPRPADTTAAATAMAIVHAGPLAERSYATREAFAAERGADPEDLKAIEAFAQEHHLTVVEASVPKRMVRLSGTIADLESAFKPDLKKARIGARVFRTRTGAISVPTSLKKIVVGVLGFDDRPVARPHLRFRDDGPGPVTPTGTKLEAKAKGKAPRAAAKGKKMPKNAADGSLKPTEVAALYGFPTNLDGSGQTIAIIELNDFDTHNKAKSTGFTPGDLKAYFKSLGLKSPHVVAVGVDGGANVPGVDSDADGEVMLDIEVVGATAPGADIAVYFAPNTDKGFLDAVSTAVHDPVRKPSVVSISWGGPEKDWTDQSMTAFDQVFQDAAAMGVTICCAAGDDGSSDIRDPADDDHKPHVDFPCSSPFALACGGTKLVGTGATVSSEVVWNGNGATGGGVSDFFKRPAYQAKSKVPKSPTKKVGRGVPDVAGDADPATGYQVREVGGSDTVIGGTSAVAPLWAGLVALLNQNRANQGKPPLGFLNPVIYGLPKTSGAFRDIVTGNNDLTGLGKYKAGKGWDACTGLGVPVANTLRQLL